MIFFKPYVNIKNFLQRYTLLKVGNLHIRIHKIVDKDRTTLFHNHPFNYISIILKGGYTESVIVNRKINKFNHKFLSIIKRKNSSYHRIDDIKGETITLFIAYGNYSWNAINTENNNLDDGLFKRIINDKELWCKKENGIWFIGHCNKLEAESESRHSIHQHDIKII